MFFRERIDSSPLQYGLAGDLSKGCKILRFLVSVEIAGAKSEGFGSKDTKYIRTKALQRYCWL